MRVLVACEESQAITKAIRERGHEAFSCDIQECSGGHPEWHICGDAIPLINGNCEFRTMDGQCHTIEGRWDLLIAHPPCTDLAVSGARHFEKKRANGSQRKSVEFFCRFLEADCDRVAIENPVGIMSGDYIKEFFPDIAEKYGLPKKASQIIQPYYWGDAEVKSTCLWIKGLPLLIPDTTEKPEIKYKEWISKDGRKKRQSEWYMSALSAKTPEERSRLRSKTFPGIARAIAEQWC